MNGYQSISSRFSLALIVVVAALLMSFAASVIYIKINRAESELDSKLSTYLKLTEVSLRVPMWNLDYETGQGVIDSLLLDKQVALAEISLTSDNRMLSATRSIDEQSYSHFATSTGFITGEIDITNAGDSIGSLRVALSRKVGHNETLLEIVGIVLLTGLLIGAIAVTSILTSRRYIATPLQRLKESASAIAQGDLDVVINVDRFDEIGLLAQDFDAMRQSINTLFSDLQTANAELEQVNRTLEDRVAERTTELVKTTHTFREILEHCPAGLHIIDQDGLLIYSNDAYRNLLGYSNEEIQNMNTSSFWFDHDQHKEVLGRIESQNGQLINHEVVFKTRDGNPLVGLISYTQTLNKIGQLGFSEGSRVAWIYDISNLKRAEEAQRQSEQRLIDALESIGEGFAFYDEADHLVLSNTRYRELLFEGVDIALSPGSSFESILRNAVHDGLIEDALEDPEAWIATRITQHRNPGAPVMQRRAGNRWLMVSERKVTGGGTVAVFTDLTELKRREAEAEESQLRLQAILDNAPALVFVKDLDGRYLLTNRAFNVFWEQPAGAVIGKTDNELFSPEQAALFQDSDSKMLASGNAIQFEDTQIIHGEHRSSVVNKFPLINQSGDAYAICAIASDVTKMKERQNELRRIADRLELALSMDGVGIWDAHLEHNKVWWSHNYTKLLGYDPETFTPTVSTWEEILHPDVADDIISRVNAFLVSDQSRLREQIHMTRADGSSIWVDSLMSVERDKTGKPLVLSGLDIDMTKQLRRERKLADANLQLKTLSSKLSKYLSPQVYDSVFTGRQEVRLASKRKKLTVFFSDIVGFTEVSDQMESEDLTVLINQYLTEMSEVAVAYGATIDKYIGDAIMIFFGDPESRGIRNDAIACVEMAIAMQTRMLELADLWRESGIEYPLQCRIGINTDYCTVGNFGSNDRMDYTILGGGVNLASRLEKQAEAGSILISYETYAHVKDSIHCEEAGEFQVKGIAYPVTAYKVCGFLSDEQNEDSLFKADLPNLKLDARPTQMTENERTKALQIVEEMLARLRTKNGGGNSIRKNTPDL